MAGRRHELGMSSLRGLRTLASASRLAHVLQLTAAWEDAAEPVGRPREASIDSHKAPQDGGLQISLSLVT